MNDKKCTVSLVFKCCDYKGECKHFKPYISTLTNKEYGKCKYILKGNCNNDYANNDALDDLMIKLSE